MLFIVRWPIVLVLLALVLVSLASAFAGTVQLAALPVDLSAILGEEDLQTLASVSWMQVALLYGAGILFLVSGIRLIRRTQGFWSWLLGFACYGGQWALSQQAQGGLVATVQSLEVGAYAQPEALLAAPESPETRIGILVLILLVGLIVFILDAADRAYWDRQEG